MTTLPLVVHYATHVMNGWSTIEDVPAEYREAVDKLCLIDLVTPVPPMQNFTFRYEDGE